MAMEKLLWQACTTPASCLQKCILIFAFRGCYSLGSFIYSGISISRTSRENANWFEKSGVREIKGGIKLHLIGRVLFDYG